MKTTQLQRFVTESNAIEGIPGFLSAELEAHKDFLALPEPTIAGLVGFVKVCQPNARLRDDKAVPGVRVGNHIAPASGPDIAKRLENILDRAIRSETTPWETHVAYEQLHPFTDGNGRSGRALWLWQMQNDNLLNYALELGFLHAFYYQTLKAQQ